MTSSSKPQPSASQPQPSATPAAGSPSSTPPVSTQPSQGSSTEPAPTQTAPQTTPANAAAGLPLHSSAEIDLKRFNELKGDDLGTGRNGKAVDDIKRLFVKQVILDDQTTMNVETIKVPGFIGITDSPTVTDASGKQVSGHEEIAKWLERDGLYICTYQWHKERYGIPIDTRKPLDDEMFTEAFMKNEGHHAGAVVPAKRSDKASFGTFNEPNDYHRGMYGKDGYVAVAQRLVFPSFVTPKQARGYTDSIICWMALLNPFTQFPADYNGGDPAHVSDRASLKELMRNGLLAALGDTAAIAFFKNPLNKCYCAEFMFVNLNTPIYPFNQQGLSLLLDGDQQKVQQILAIQTAHNRRMANVLSTQTSNPEFKAFNIPMPVVPEDLPPLDKLMTQNGQTIDPNSIPFPPFKISQVIRRAYRTLLPRQQAITDMKLADAQARMFKFMEPALIQQLGLEGKPATDPQVMAVKQFVVAVSQQLDQSFPSYEAFDQAMDAAMAQADQMLAGDGDRARFVPPRIYVDLGQNDGDTNLPRGWGFRLETVGALVARSVIK